MDQDGNDAFIELINGIRNEHEMLKKDIAELGKLRRDIEELERIYKVKEEIMNDLPKIDGFDGCFK